MGNRLKMGLYIISGVLIIWVIISFAIKLLVWFLPFILILYVLFKIKGYFNNKRKKNSRNIDYNAKDNVGFDKFYPDEIDDSVGEIIDVEYKEIDKQ